ncbi:MAG: plastocyanin/azurin family copper-binding protein [Phycisphaerae bacterium]|jgi:plastocyanin
MNTSLGRVSGVIVVSCILGAAFPALGVTHTVNQVDFAFDPADIVVAPGDTVEWIWSSGSHTVTSGTPCTADDVHFNEPLTSGNPTVTFVVPNDGTTLIPYFCSPHCLGGMVGSITIEGNPIPTVSQWGLVLTALLLTAAGTVVFTRRRATANAA